MNSELFLIFQIFCMEIILKNREENFLPADIIPQMFSNIKSIYQFHNDFLLPQLQSCMSKLVRVRITLYLL